MTSIISSESDTISDKCRCCTNPSGNFIKLETSIKTSEGLEKTYRDLLYEITNFQVNENFILPLELDQYDNCSLIFFLYRYPFIRSMSCHKKYAINVVNS